MFIEILSAIILGCCMGIVTGLIPGIHINLVAILLVSVANYFLQFFQPITLGVFVIAMSITHTFLDSIPSIFLGAPDSEQALNVLPGHVMLLRGMGFEAVKLTVIGSLLCLLTTLLIIPLLVPVAPWLYDIIKPYMGYILLVIVVFMIVKVKEIDKIFWSLFLFLASGVLGLLVFNLNMSQPLFPLLSGLFGVSTLVISLGDKVKIPEQRVTDMILVEKKNIAKALAAGTFSGCLTGLFPGLGAAQAAVIGTQLVRDIGVFSYMILVGGINTVNFLFSLVTLYTLEKARNGAVIAVMEIMKSVDFNGFLIFLFSALVAGCIATFLALKIAKVFARMITKINYTLLVMSVITLVTVLTIVLSSWLGLLVLVVATCIGFIAPVVGIPRSNAMGCLMLPVILYFLL